MKTTHKSFFILYAMMLMSTDCTCDCPPMTYEQIFTDLELTAWDTSGFRDTEVETTAPKNAFGLTVYVISELTTIPNALADVQLGSFGLAYAFSDCDCIDENTFPDPMQSISIWATDIQTEEETEVTNIFTAYDYNDEDISVQEDFENRHEGKDYFRWELSDDADLPDQVRFRVKIVLTSAKELSAETQDITFE